MGLEDPFPLMVSLLLMPDDILKEHDLTQTMNVYAEIQANGICYSRVF